jgi:hypothetical protein
MVDTPRTRTALLALLSDRPDNTVDASGNLVSGTLNERESVQLLASHLRDVLVSAMPVEQVLTVTAGAVAWNMDNAPAARITLTQNTTVTVTGGEDGRSYVLAVVQGGAGSFTTTLTGCTVHPAAPAWLTGVGSVTLARVHVSAGVRHAVISG